MTLERTRLLSLSFVLAFAANFTHSLSFHAFLHLPGFIQSLGARELQIGLLMGTSSAVASSCNFSAEMWRFPLAKSSPAKA